MPYKKTKTVNQTVQRLTAGRWRSISELHKTTVNIRLLIICEEMDVVGVGKVFPHISTGHWNHRFQKIQFDGHGAKNYTPMGWLPIYE